MPSLDALFEELELGYYVVPEIQRPFVWRNPQVLELANSIYRHYPVGGICIWELPPKFYADYKEFFQPLADGFPKDNGKYMVIDGRQRLTSILLLKHGLLYIGSKKRELKLFFDPVNEVFKLERRKNELDNKPNWFRVSEIFSTDDVYELIERKKEKLGGSLGVHEKIIHKGLSRLITQFKTYEITFIKAKMQVGSDDDLITIFDRVSEIFVTLNEKGTKVKLHDLAKALLTGKSIAEIGTSFTREFDRVRTNLSKDGFEVPETVLMRTYLAIATGSVKFSEAKHKLQAISPGDSFKYLESVEEAFSRAVEVFREYGIKTFKYLQSRYLPIIPAVYLHKEYIQPKKVVPLNVKKDLVRWLILASFSKRYTGRLESDLYEDMKNLEEGRGLEGLLKSLPHTSISFEELKGEYENMHITLLQILYSLNNTHDWNVLLNENKSEPLIKLSPDDLSIHHIFPEDLLIDHEIDDEELLNDFANITLTSKRVNSHIHDNPPHQYLKQLNEKDPELLKQHLIPSDPILWKTENYNEFLESRRRLIAEAIKEKLSLEVLGE